MKNKKKTKGFLRLIIPNPPKDPKLRKLWDAERHSERIFRRRLIEELISEHAYNWRPMILEAYRKNGLSSAEESHAYCVNFFLDLKKRGEMTHEEAKGIIENFDGFINAIRKMDENKNKSKK